MLGRLASMNKTSTPLMENRLMENPSPQVLKSAWRPLLGVNALWLTLLSSVNSNSNWPKIELWIKGSFEQQPPWLRMAPGILRGPRLRCCQSMHGNSCWTPELSPRSDVVVDSLSGVTTTWVVKAKELCGVIASGQGTYVSHGCILDHDSFLGWPWSGFPVRLTGNGTISSLNFPAS